MARKFSAPYPGAAYHVMNRATGGRNIIQSDNDRRLFLGTLGQACERMDWQERKAVACENTLF